MGRLRRRIGQRQRHHALRHLGPQRRDARRPGLVAQQAVHPLGHEPRLPAPDARLGLARPAHDLGGPEAVGGRQNDPGPPHVLLRAVPIRDDRFQSGTVRGAYLDGDTFAHPPRLAQGRPPWESFTRRKAARRWPMDVEGRGRAALYPLGADEQGARRAAAAPAGTPRRSRPPICAGVDEFHPAGAADVALARELAPRPAPGCSTSAPASAGRRGTSPRPTAATSPASTSRPPSSTLATELTARDRPRRPRALRRPAARSRCRSRTTPSTLATMFHVGMNIADKARALRRGRAGAAPRRHASASTR